MMMEKQIAEKLIKLFVNRNDVYAEAYLLEDKKRMAYAKKDYPIDTKLLLEQIKGKKTIGAYQLKENKVKWGLCDFDLNTPEDFEKAVKLFFELKREGLNPLMEKSGGGDYKIHIWIFCDCEAKDIKDYLEEICKKIKVMPNEIFPKQTETKKEDYGNLVKLPLGLHLVTNRKSCFLDNDFNEVKSLKGINEILDFHLNHIDKIPKVIVKEKVITQFKTEDKKPSEFDNFFNFVLRNELPAGKTAKEKKYEKIVGINDNVLKNEAIWFYQKGYTLEQLEQEVKPIYEANGWAFGDLKGWYKKVLKPTETFKGTEINAGELAEYCIQAERKDLLELLPQEKKDNKEDLPVLSDEDLTNFVPPKEMYHIKGIMPVGSVGLITGKRQERKTFLMNYLALCLASGKSVFGKYEVPTPKKVLIIDEETGIPETKNHISTLKKGLGITTNLPIAYISFAGIKFDDEKKQKQLYNFIKEFQPDVIFVDCLQRVLYFNVDKENQLISEFMTDFIRPTINEFKNLSWVFIHHYRKSLQGNRIDDWLDEIRGGSELTNYCRFIWGVQRPRHQDSETEDQIILKQLKMSNLPPVQDQVISFVTEDSSVKVDYLGFAAEILARDVLCANAIKEWLIAENITKEFRTKEAKEAMEKLGFKSTITSAGLKILVEEGFLKKIKQGYYQVSDKAAMQKKLVGDVE